MVPFEAFVDFDWGRTSGSTQLLGQGRREGNAVLIDFDDQFVEGHRSSACQPAVGVTSCRVTSVTLVTP